MTFNPTPEQEALVAAARDTSDNLLVNALAGAAKTSSLVLMAEALKREMILCLAFNKKISVEMEARLPGNCSSMTLNSLGHRAWAEYLSVRLRLDTGKGYRILKEEVEKLKGNDKEEAYEDFAETLKMIQQGKRSGYVPDGKFKYPGLCGDDDFFIQLDTESSHLQEHLIRKVSAQGIREAEGGIIDFDDQIMMPALWPCTFQQFPVVMVDEAQDLSPLNHRTLQKLVNRRLIAVGDPCQAIYGFRGADEDSMSNMRQMFSMHEMTLSISFRCPRSVVREAQWRAPHMRWPDWAEEGSVRHLERWNSDTIPKDAAIICRNNAPLYTLAITMLKNGRYCKIVGNDVGKGLIKVMQKLGDKSLNRDEALAKVEAWQTRELTRARNKDLVYDKADCMRIFIKEAETLGGAITYADHIMAQEGTTQLMTGHKSKGLEFDDVFILDAKLLHAEGQDRNLLYVMQTRAKKNLTYITSESFEDEKEHL